MDKMKVFRRAWHHGRVFFLLAMVCAGMCASPAFGQVVQQLRGHVTDPSGAIVPKAEVTVINEATKVETPTTSSSSGDWVVPYLQPGNYTVKVSATGFETETVAGVELNVGQARAVDTSLKVGESKITVTVTATELALQTASADELGVIPGALVADTPQNYRNVMATSITVAGAGSKNGLYTQQPYGNVTSGIVFNSSAGSLNIDGVNNMSTGFQTMAYIPLVDAVQEMVVDMTPYDAGAVGFATAGNIDVHLKSGTNKFHGTLYEYYRSTGLDANTWQNNFKGLGRPSHKSNQFGFEADGPVVIPHFYDGHDKTFFTAAFEIYNLTSPNSTSLYSVPGVFGQPSWLTPTNGYYQFAGLTQTNGAPITLYDPTTLGYGGNANARKSFYQEGAPNTYSIPASRVSAAALAILKYFPAPNTVSAGSPPWQNNYYNPTSVVSHYKNGLIKIDHNFSAKDRLTVRWGWWNQFQSTYSNGLPASNPAAYGQLPSGQKFQNPAGEWIHTFSPQTILDVKASIDMDENETKAAYPFDPSSLGLPNVSGGVTQQGLLNYFPQITLSGFDQLGSTASSIKVDNELNLLPSLTLIRGKNDIHVGIDNREYQISQKQNSGGLAISSNANWTQQFNNNTADAASGNTIASFLLDNGYLSGGSITQPTQMFESYHYYGAFIQDNLKALPKLTLNIGLRYDFPSQAVERHNRFTNFFDTSVVNPIASAAEAQGYPGLIHGGLTFSGVNGVSRTQLPRAWYMLEPRFGLSYQVEKNTVVHAGFGMAYNWAAYTGAQTGFSSSTSITPSLTTNYTTPYSTLANPFPAGYVQSPGASLGYLAGLGTSISYYNHFTKFGQTWSFSVGVQHQFTKGDILDVSYVGKQFMHGPTGAQLDLPGSQWYAQCDVTNNAGSATSPGNAALCTASNTGNPFVGINGFQGTSLYTAAKIQSGQLNFLYPHYTGVSENGAYNYNGLWLNSLQLTETHRFSSSLTATTTYEYARIMDNNGIFDYTQGGGGAISNPNYLLRIQDANDLNHRITFIGSYKLPVGHDRQFFSNMPRYLDAIVGGWNISSIYLYESGRPWQPQCGGGQGSSLGGSTGCFYLPNGTSSYKVPRTATNYGGSQIIRGAIPCVADTNPNTGVVVLRSGATAYGCTQADFVYKAAYAPAQNLVSSGVRLGANSEFDLNVMKSFDLYENYKFILKCDAFNVTNHAVWNNSYQTSNDIYFGSLIKGTSAPGNNPRYLQLSATVRW